MYDFDILKYFSYHQAEVGDPPRLMLLKHRMHSSFRRGSRQSVATLLFTPCIAHPTRSSITIRRLRRKDTISLHFAWANLVVWYSHMGVGALGLLGHQLPWTIQNSLQDWGWGCSPTDAIASCAWYYRAQEPFASNGWCACVREKIKIL